MHAAERLPPRDEVEDCWRRIGVRGDKSCPELARHAHCRNCATYAAGAARLLDRREDAPDDNDWKQGFAAEAPEARHRSQAAMLLRIGEEWVALPVAALDQIVERRPVHALPHRRNPALLGIVNVRGKLLVCISLAALLGIEAGKEGGQRMVVLRMAGGPVVFPVDEVQHDHRFHEGELLAVPATSRMSQSNHALGMLRTEKGLAALIDIDRLAGAVEGGFQ